MASLSGRSPEFAQFWSERRLATLSTVRPDGTPHVVPVGVTLDAEGGLARVITSGDSHKARQVLAAGPAGAAVAVCQVEGRQWSTLEGRGFVVSDPESVADAERRYAERYRVPRVNPHRVVLQIVISRVLGNL